MAPNNVDTRRRFLSQILQAWIIALVLLVSPAPVLALGNPTAWEYPLDQESAGERTSSEAALPDFKGFVKSLENGQKETLRGVYVPGVFAIPIIQQPVGHPGFVSPTNGVITQFNMAAEVGNIGLLAHNNLSGASFTGLMLGHEIRLIYGDGTVEYFIVNQILKYQALQPYSPSSEFRDLETNTTISAEKLFQKVYRGERHVTFQTCIEANGLGSWGRLFIIAQPKLNAVVE